ncbi:hypothetical protein PCASD_19663 [Puccinia coronata f. sp. avenae]|uniref:Uncharacterized protein n=1 Tax=Puccinia coronata f. sp. avenae TaxID=200324 RepID=A0A2N5TLV2_9BASI|nr:hypothetical protein PCASD_19663 [Puccinia coronata f. sp. avenae]
MLAVDTTHQPGKPNAQLVMQKATGDDAPTSPSDRDSSDNGEAPPPTANTTDNAAPISLAKGGARSAEEAIPSPGLADTSSALDECGTPVEAATTLPAGSTPDPSPLPTGETYVQLSLPPHQNLGSPKPPADDVPSFSSDCDSSNNSEPLHQSPNHRTTLPQDPIVIALIIVNPIHQSPNQRTTLRQVPQQMGCPNLQRKVSCCWSFPAQLLCPR